jgi:hypothetical protein
MYLKKRVSFLHAVLTYPYLFSARLSTNNLPSTVRVHLCTRTTVFYIYLAMRPVSTGYRAICHRFLRHRAFYCCSQSLSFSLHCFYWLCCILSLFPPSSCIIPLFRLATLQSIPCFFYLTYFYHCCFLSHCVYHRIPCFLSFSSSLPPFLIYS